MLYSYMHISEHPYSICLRIPAWYIDSTIPVLSKSEIFKQSSVVVQSGFCRAWSENPKTGFLISRLISTPGSADGLLKSWNLDICDFADNFVGHSGTVTCLAISGDNSFAVSGSVDTTLKVWSLILATIITNYRVCN